MNAMRPEKTETTETETVDSNLAAVTEVEAGIRDFVRNDIAYLRRPAATTTDAPPLDPSAEATVTNVNSLIQRVAGTSLAEIENLISELESPARPAPCRRPARPAGDLRLRPAQPGRDEVDPHDRRQRRAVEARRRRPAQQLIGQHPASPAAAFRKGRGGFDSWGVARSSTTVSSPALCALAHWSGAIQYSRDGGD
ncbi:hypothetical protein BRDID11002_72080 [Bradyrhizobium diazoefficiens]